MTQAATLISVVVPTYNQAQYLGACLDSIWFQDYPNIEIVVVADPSPDDTAEVLAAFRRSVARNTVSHAARLEPDGTVSRAEYPRYRAEGRSLVIHESPVRLGHTPSYNKGFELASGEYCTYIASDDICHPQMLSELAGPLDRDEADFVFSDMFVVDDAMRILREFRLPDYSFEASFCDWYLCGVSKLYRRSLHERFGYYDDGYTANDHECFLRFAINGARFKHVPKTLYSVRSHDQRGQDVHSEASWRKLLAESSELVRRARAFRERESFGDGMILE
ncbi:glycosyltransferase family 2 protein [Pseudodesulfovibrio karagichevae]|uniref:Glycosyltransferase family 2 protein n=1 Tax=Pseudodesulfovibrio karagichevae TaxID=3239305 RepID=A0ABV4K586_9BACT